MKILAIIVLLACIVAALVVTLSLGDQAWMMPAVFGASAAMGAIFRWLLARFASHWSPRRSRVIAAGTLPALLWLLAFAVDVTGYIQHLQHPNEGFMIGVSIMLLLPCGMAFCAGLAGAVIAETAMERAR